MNRPRLSALLAVPLVSLTALAQDTPGAIATHAYTALTATTASRQGEVVAAGTRWSCTGTRCRAEAPWVAPAVADCKALVRAVGAVRAFGRDRGVQLTTEQLAECNAIPALSKSKNTPAASAPAPGTRPTGPATGAAAGNAIREQVLRNRAGVNFTPPETTDSATAAKVRFLREAGVTLRPAAFAASIWLTPQHPYVDASTYLSADARLDTRPTFTPTAEMPYGSLTVTSSPVRGGWAMQIRFANNPARYYLAQCYVSGRDEYGIYHAAGDRKLTARDGRISFVIEPALERPLGLKIWGVGAETSSWKFGGCEITPFSL